VAGSFVEGRRQREHRVDLKLERAATIEGRVLSAKGRPLAGARLWWGATYDDGARKLEGTTTDACGRFVIDHLRIDKHRLVVSAKDGACATSAVEISTLGPVNVDVRVLPRTHPRVVRVRVVDHQGRPVEGLAVRVNNLLWGATERDGRLSAQVDEDLDPSAGAPALRPIGAVAVVAIPLLVTNRGLGLPDPAVDEIGVKWGAMGLSVANAATRKLVALLGIKLAPDVYVGEVVVTGTVKGTAWDDGSAKLEPSAIADRFFAMHQACSARSTVI
jgi:hypothetical protein